MLHPRLSFCLQLSVAALAPWGVVVLLLLAFIETYRLAALWDEEDFEKRAYPGKQGRVTEQALAGQFFGFLREMNFE